MNAEPTELYDKMKSDDLESNAGSEKVGAQCVNDGGRDENPSSPEGLINTGFVSFCFIHSLALPGQHFFLSDLFWCTLEL